MIGKAYPAKIRLREVLVLDQRTHAAIEHQDSFGEQLCNRIPAHCTTASTEPVTGFIPSKRQIAAVSSARFRV